MVEEKAGRALEVTRRTGEVQIKMNMGNSNRIPRLPELTRLDPDSSELFGKVVDLSAEVLRDSLGPLAGSSFED